MVPHRITCKNRGAMKAVDCASLLDTDIIMGDRSANDRSALSYRDTGMRADIGPV